MLGLMQDYPLLVQTILDHAALNHGDREMVTRSIEGPIRRRNYRDLRIRALRVAKALQKEGVVLGDRIATMAWNTDRHVEVWYGIMGLGAISHTINPRLFVEQLVYIMNHAEDKILFVDLTFVPLIEAIATKIPSIKKYIILTDEAHMPETSLPNGYQLNIQFGIPIQGAEQNTGKAFAQRSYPSSDIVIRLRKHENCLVLCKELGTLLKNGIILF